MNTGSDFRRGKIWDFQYNHKFFLQSNVIGSIPVFDLMTYQNENQATLTKSSVQYQTNFDLIGLNPKTLSTSI